MMNEQQPLSFWRKLANPRSWAYGLFWSWNIIFLAFMLLGFAPRLLPDLLTAVRGEAIPAAFLVYALLLTLIPVVAVVLGLTLLRRAPGRLLILGYGVEGPLMLMLAVRFFVVREMTLAMLVPLSAAALGVVTLLWAILDGNIDRRGPILAHVRAIGLTLLLLVGLYASLWLAFYAAPAAVLAWEPIGDLLRNVPEPRWMLLWGLGIILGVYSATLLVLMPIAVPILYARAWWRGVRSLSAIHGPLRSLLLTGLVVGVGGLSFLMANQQPQQLAFALLKQPPGSPAEAQALLDRQEEIRAGLLNTYLAPARYVSAVGEVRHVSAMYEAAFDMPAVRAQRVQRLYEAVARPALYVPVNQPQWSPRVDNRALVDEPLEAAKLYESFFDRPIIEGEHDAVVRAARSTWSIEQAQTAWRAIDDREVHIARQEVTVTEKGDWAEIELYEVYQNQTSERQEVIYYFSLPESAVITGLWLGNSPDREARFSYRVSPRGAAQALYRNEVQRRYDPALVEQIGPRQYRLRIFPVQPQRWRNDEASGHSLIEEAPPLHMWLTWRVLAQENTWPLPRLAERRNVYWDETSLRLVNGAPMRVDPAAWLPAWLPARGPVVPVAHRVDFPGGETVIVRPASSDELPPMPEDLRLAVVLDRSRSMASLAGDVNTALGRLEAAAGRQGGVDVYLTASRYRGETPARIGLASLDPETIMYFGGQNAAELLAQFDALRADQKYDAVLVLTDGSGYELGAGDFPVTPPDAPVWMVHLGGDYPLGYDDATLEAIQASGGGVAGGVDEALTRLAMALAGGSGAPSADVVDGYVWSTLPTPAAERNSQVVVHPPTDPFAALAARRVILETMHRQRGVLDQVATLDHLHDLAIEYGIVTPYSSMLVLVDASQARLLAQLEARDDRFLREIEEVGETAPQNPFSVTGVPEPEEWLLLVLVAAMIIWYMRTRRVSYVG
jgi:putative PEP-CTERM system integral membrane protein